MSAQEDDTFEWHAGERQQGELHIRIAGVLTIYEAAALQRRLLECLQQATVVCVDAGGIQEIDTAGFQLLAAAARQASAAGGRLVLENVSDAIRDLLTAYGQPSFITVSTPAAPATTGAVHAQ